MIESHKYKLIEFMEVYYFLLQYRYNIIILPNEHWYVTCYFFFNFLLIKQIYWIALLDQTKLSHIHPTTSYQRRRGSVNTSVLKSSAAYIVFYICENDVYNHIFPNSSNSINKLCLITVICLMNNVKRETIRCLN